MSLSLTSKDSATFWPLTSLGTLLSTVKATLSLSSFVAKPFPSWTWDAHTLSGSCLDLVLKQYTLPFIVDTRRSMKPSLSRSSKSTMLYEVSPMSTTSAQPVVPSTR